MDRIEGTASDANGRVARVASRTANEPKKVTTQRNGKSHWNLEGENATLIEDTFDCNVVLKVVRSTPERTRQNATKLWTQFKDLDKKGRPRISEGGA